MLDTGSTRSFISPRKAMQHFAPYIYYEPFQVISTHASSKHSQVIQIPLFEIFQTNLCHKFYVYNVDDKYDGLIGSDLLKQLRAKIDMENQLLITQTATIPIIYHSPLSYELKIPSRSEIKVKLPTTLYDGTGILDYKEFHSGVRMPSALVHCVNGFATTIIQNTLEADAMLNVTGPFHISKYDPDSCEINLTDIRTDDSLEQILTQNLQKLRLDHMNEQEKECIFQLCLEFKDIFYSDQIPLTFTNQVKHHIRTKNEDPIFVKPYRQAQTVAAEIDRQVAKLLADNVITESFSPWSAPVHLVPKKADASGEAKYRMVIDYRRLNDITIDDKYPLPNITDLFDKLGKSIYFSTLDLASGYHQIEVFERDREKTAFSTQNGHFEFCRMPFGLKTAPATFQRTIDNVLRGLQGLHCMSYLDDIIIYSSSLEEHLQKLRIVFERLRQHNFKVQLDKSEFFRKEVLYLGHKITKEGLKPNDDKIKAVLKYPIPRTPTEIKSFLGLIGYYRKFIKDFAKITKPLTSCLKKGKKIVIDETYIDAFNKCKELLVNAPILQYPDPEKPYILTTDASLFAIGAVLSQGSIGSDRPIAYASRTLTETETRYSAIERELLAIIWAIKHFRPYLFGKEFYIYTDHKPLVWLDSLKDPNSKLTRWRLKLLDFNYKIIHKSGRQNTNADALSRVKINAIDSLSDFDSLKVNIDKKEKRLQDQMEEVTQKILTLCKNQQDKILANKNKNEEDKMSVISLSDTESTAKASSIGSETITVSSPPRNKEPIQMIPSISDSSTETIHSCRDLDTSDIPILHEAIDTKPNQILVFIWFRNEIQVKDISRDKQKIKEVFLPVDNEELIKQFLKEYIKPNVKYFIYFEHENHRRLFSTIVTQLFKKDTVKIIECTQRVVYIEDEIEQKEIILKYHTGKTCHRGIRETLMKLKRHYYWPRMQEIVSAVLNECDICKETKYDRHPIKPMLQLTQTQNAPFQEIFIDLFTIEGAYYLTIVDAFSKLGQAIEISNRSTPEVVRALIKYFSFYGIPKKITSDPGSEFNNELMRDLAKFYKIDLHITTPNNPNSTSIVERFHSTLIEIFRLAKYERKCTDASSVMTYSIMAYNNTIHSTTELTPFEVVFGHTDAGNLFDADFEKEYMQQLMKEHVKRTRFLYTHIAQQMKHKKEKVRNKRGGEVDVEIGNKIFSKVVNKRKSKEKPLYQKAQVSGEITRNVVPIIVKGRDTKVPLKNVKRPPQVVFRDLYSDPRPGPSTASD